MAEKILAKNHVKSFSLAAINGSHCTLCALQGCHFASFFIGSAIVIIKECLAKRNDRFSTILRRLFSRHISQGFNFPLTVAARSFVMRRKIVSCSYMFVIFTYVYVYSEMNDEPPRRIIVNRKAALDPMSRTVRPRSASRLSGNVYRC